MMRDQIGVLLSGAQVSTDDHEVYRTLVAEMPDELGSDESFKMSYLMDVGGKRSDKIQSLSTSVRQMAKSDLSIKARSLGEVSHVGKGKSKKTDDDFEEEGDDEEGDDDADGYALDDIEMLERGDIDDLEDAEGEDHASSPGEND